MKPVIFNSETNLVCVNTLMNYDIYELREICESVNINTLNATPKTLITKIKVHFNQNSLLSERINASLPDNQNKSITIENEEYLQFLAFKAKQKSGFVNSGNTTVTPYTTLKVGTVLSKNGKVLIVVSQPTPTSTVLCSTKLCWENTNVSVTGIGSTIVIEGTGFLPESYENSEFNVILERAKVYLRENTIKKCKNDIKTISESLNSGKLTNKEIQLISLFVERISNRETLNVLTELSQTEYSHTNELNDLLERAESEKLERVNELLNM